MLKYNKNEKLRRYIILDNILMSKIRFINFTEGTKTIFKLV